MLDQCWADHATCHDNPEDSHALPFEAAQHPAAMTDQQMES